MGALRGAVATAVAVASLVACATVDRADAGGPDDPSLLLFSGTDLWRYGGFLYGGLLWAPAGLDNSGFIGKVLLDGGEYSYVSGDLNENIDGTKLSAAALPGWRFIRDGLTVSLFGGPVVQDYRLTPFDPGSRLHGLYAGAEFASDIWYQPNATTMAAVNSSIATIGPTGYVRATFGFRFLAPVFRRPRDRATVVRGLSADGVWRAHNRSAYQCARVVHGHRLRTNLGPTLRPLSAGRI